MSSQVTPGTATPCIVCRQAIGKLSVAESFPMGYNDLRYLKCQSGLPSVYIHGVKMEYVTSDDTRKLLQAIEQLYSIRDVHSFATSYREIVNRLISPDTPIEPPDSASELAAVPVRDRYESSHTQQTIDTFYNPDRIADLSERDRSILNLLYPHLIRSYQTACQFDRQQQAILKMQASIDCLGLIFLNDRGDVVEITDLAARWIDRYYAKTQNKQLPEQLQTWVKCQIERLKHTNGIPSSGLPLRVKLSDCELITRLVIDPIRDRYILILCEEKSPPLNDSLEHIGLSSREAEILAMLIQGKNPKGMAKTLKISPATARKHLENIYRKLNVQSQAEAIVKALETIGVLSSLSTLHQWHF